MGFATLALPYNHVGPAGHGALVKLSANALLGIQTAALAEIIAMLREQGVDAGTAVAATSSTTAWALVANYLADTMISGVSSLAFPVALIEKDLAYASQVTADAGALPVVGEAKAVFQRAIAAGLGEKNMTSVFSLYR